MATSQNKEKFEDYEGFVEKFKLNKKPRTVKPFVSTVRGFFVFFLGAERGI